MTISGENENQEEKKAKEFKHEKTSSMKQKKIES